MHLIEKILTTTTMITNMPTSQKLEQQLAALLHILEETKEAEQWEAEEAEQQEAEEAECQWHMEERRQEQERAEQERWEEEACTESVWQATEERCHAQVHAEVARDR